MHVHSREYSLKQWNTLGYAVKVLHVWISKSISYVYSDVFCDVTHRSRGVVYSCGWQKTQHGFIPAWCFLLNLLPKKRVRGENAVHKMQMDWEYFF